MNYGYNGYNTQFPGLNNGQQQNPGFGGMDPNNYYQYPQPDQQQVFENYLQRNPQPMQSYQQLPPIPNLRSSRQQLNPLDLKSRSQPVIGKYGQGYPRQTFQQNGSFGQAQPFRTRTILNPNLGYNEQSNKYPPMNFNDMFPMMMAMSMMGNKGQTSKKDKDDTLILEQINRQNKQMQQQMGPAKQTKNKNRDLLINKIDKLEKKLSEEDKAQKANHESPMMSLFFMQNMMQSQNSMVDMFQKEGKGQPMQQQDAMQKFQLMKLMESMGKKNNAKKVIFIVEFLLKKIEGADSSA